MESHSDVINAWGDISLFAADAGVTRNHACVMKARKSIPREYWDDTILGASKRNMPNITLSLLSRLAPTRSNSAKVRATIPANSPQRKAV